jgi:hypothetical protein
MRDEIPEPMPPEETEAFQPTVESFLNDISEVVNMHANLGRNGQIGLLIQSACQLACMDRVPKKRFLKACNSYYINVKTMMDKMMKEH